MATCLPCEASDHLHCVDRLRIGGRMCDCDTCASIRLDAENDLLNEKDKEKEEDKWQTKK